MFSGKRSFEDIEHLLLNQDVCSVIACREMGYDNTCGMRYPTSETHYRYKFIKLDLQTSIPSSNMTKVMPNTLTQELLPIQPTDFDYKLQDKCKTT